METAEIRNVQQYFQHISALKLDIKQKQCDILIVGGGIAALGIAQALSNTSYSTVLIDRRTLGSGTSANSLRIMHGGFRYLQSLQVGRSFSSMAEQIRLQELYPDLMKALPCVLPLRSGSLRSAIPLTLASLYYSLSYMLLTGELVCKGRVHLNNKGVQFDALPGYAPAGLFCWDDVQLLDHYRLVQRIRDALEEKGVLSGEGIEFLAAEKTDSGWSIQVRDNKNEGNISAAVIVNATGPWLPDVCARMGLPVPFRPLYWARASNLIVNRVIEPHYGVALDGYAGGLLFMTPREGQTAIGTFYTPFTGSPDHTDLTVAEINTLRTAVNRVLPGRALLPEDIVGVDTGILPARHVKAGAPQLYGASRIAVAGNSVHVLSTKYTTFLSQGEKVARKVLSLLSSRR